MERRTSDSDPKISLIGLNKTATISLHMLFLGSGIPSIHWRDRKHRNVAQAMMSNIATARPPLFGFDAIAFSDLSYTDTRVVIEGARFYRELQEAYPDAYFIYNTRPVDDWIASRIAHDKGGYLARAAKATQLTNAEVVASWRQLYANHREDILWYFHKHPRFITFDISQDEPDKIATLVRPHYAIDLDCWGHFHETQQPDVQVAA